MHWIDSPVLNAGMLNIMAQIKLQSSSECYNQRKLKTQFYLGTYTAKESLNEKAEVKTLLSSGIW